PAPVHRPNLDERLVGDRRGEFEAVLAHRLGLALTVLEPRRDRQLCLGCHLWSLTGTAGRGPAGGFAEAPRSSSSRRFDGPLPGVPARPAAAPTLARPGWPAE